MCPPASEPAPRAAQWFSTTHWSVVRAAKEAGTPGTAAALEKLCRTYWPPLYAYIRREGHDATEAQDLTQDFFTRLLTRDYLQRVHHGLGKFRSFLLAYLKHFLSEERRKAGAQKRGGGCVFVSLDKPGGEDGYLLEPVDDLTPDQVFERKHSTRPHLIRRALGGRVWQGWIDAQETSEGKGASRGVAAT